MKTEISHKWVEILRVQPAIITRYGTTANKTSRLYKSVCRDSTDSKLITKCYESVPDIITINPRHRPTETIALYWINEPQAWSSFHCQNECGDTAKSSFAPLEDLAGHVPVTWIWWDSMEPNSHVERNKLAVRLPTLHSLFLSYVARILKHLTPSRKSLKDSVQNAADECQRFTLSIRKHASLIPTQHNSHRAEQPEQPHSSFIISTLNWIISENESGETSKIEGMRFK